MASLPLYTQNKIYNLLPGEVNWKKGDTVQILPTFPNNPEFLWITWRFAKLIYDWLFRNYPIREVALLSDSVDIHCNKIIFRDIFPYLTFKRAPWHPRAMAPLA